MRIKYRKVVKFQGTWVYDRKCEKNQEIEME